MIDYKNVQPLDDFNWDEFESGSKAGNGEGELTKAYDETLNKIQEHQVVEGTVISIDKKEVVVNIGYKSDGIIPASEFRYNPDLKVGDKVEVSWSFLTRRLVFRRAGTTSTRPWRVTRSSRATSRAARRVA